MACGFRQMRLSAYRSASCIWTLVVMSSRSRCALTRTTVHIFVRCLLNNVAHVAPADLTWRGVVALQAAALAGENETLRADKRVAALEAELDGVRQELAAVC